MDKYEVERLHASFVSLLHLVATMLVIVLLLMMLALLAQPASARHNFRHTVDQWQHRSFEGVPNACHNRRREHVFCGNRRGYKKVAPQRIIKKRRVIRKKRVIRRRVIRRGGCSWKTVRNNRGVVVYHKKVCWRR